MGLYEVNPRHSTCSLLLFDTLAQVLVESNPLSLEAQALWNVTFDPVIVELNGAALTWTNLQESGGSFSIARSVTVLKPCPETCLLERVMLLFRKIPDPKPPIPKRVAPSRIAWPAAFGPCRPVGRLSPERMLM